MHYRGTCTECGADWNETGGRSLRCPTCGSPNVTSTREEGARPAYIPDAGDVAVAAKAAATLEDHLRELRAGLVRLSGETRAAGRQAIEAELDELIGSCFASTGRAYFHLTRRLLVAGRRESEPRPLTQADLTRAARRDAEAGREAEGPGRTTVDGLPPLCLRALREEFAGHVETGRLELTARTATWTHQAPAEVLAMLESTVRNLRGYDYPRRELLTVLRAVKRQVPGKGRARARVAS